MKLSFVKDSMRTYMLYLYMCTRLTMDYLKNKDFDMVLKNLAYTWKYEKKLVWTEHKWLL